MPPTRPGRQGQPAESRANDPASLPQQARSRAALPQDDLQTGDVISGDRERHPRAGIVAELNGRAVARFRRHHVS